MNQISPSNGEASVRVLRKTSELEEIRTAWESWPGNRDSEMEPYLTFLQSSPGTLRPHVLVVYRDGKPDAIVVGRIDLGLITCRLGYLRLNLRARILCFVYGALRGNPSRENCDLIVSSVLRSLSDHEADVAYFSFLKQDTDLCQLAMKRPGFFARDHVRISQPHFATTLPATAEEFYRGLSPKVRKNQKWQAKKFVNQFSGAVRIHCYRAVADFDKMIQDVEQVAKKSYQRGLGVGFMDSPKMREGLWLMASRGWLRAYVLYAAERPCAFWMGDVNRGTFGSDYLAYDAEFAKYSPGIFLILKVIEGFCDGKAEGVTAVDFGPGNAQYKEVLSNQEWQETAVHIFATSSKGIRLNLTRTVIGGMDQAIKKGLSHVGLLQKVKKRWRERARLQGAPQS